ncbi:MAG: hypothetical protein ABI197_01625, partial [Granulicella sp.]
MEPPGPLRADEIAEAMDAHVQHVVQSSLFLRAETLRKLLIYLWDHRTEEISEYAVATEALGRRADFDPKTDASARVQISRLRRKLKDFYETEGIGDAFRLHIPMGTHVLMIVEGSIPSTSLMLLEGEPELPFTRLNETRFLRQKRLVVGLAVMCTLLLIVVSLLAWNLYKARTLPPRSVAMPTSFWTAFVGVNN